MLGELRAGAARLFHHIARNGTHLLLPSRRDSTYVGLPAWFLTHQVSTATSTLKPCTQGPTRLPHGQTQELPEH